MRTLTTLIVAIISVAVIGLAINAFAHGGMGMGWANDSSHGGQGRYHRGGYDYDPGNGESSLLRAKWGTTCIPASA